MRCCLDDHEFWRFERANEPSDVEWGNLHIGGISRVLRTLFAFALSCSILLVCWPVVGVCKLFQKAIKMYLLDTTDNELKNGWKQIVEGDKVGFEEQL